MFYVDFLCFLIVFVPFHVNISACVNKLSPFKSIVHSLSLLMESIPTCQDVFAGVLVRKNCTLQVYCKELPLLVFGLHGVRRTWFVHPKRFLMS